MSRIHILPPDLADKIAAGEVVERPASVVKELVENALDAGATFVRVAVEQAGKEKIEVSDNGCGMSLEEAKLAIQRHATSKISCLDDLFAIRTLGFRGEALPSIASVSHFVLETKSKREGALEGARVEVRGGEPVLARTAGCPVGARVVVDDLFYNTPARRKFLKSDAVEAGHIEDVLTRLALSRLDCGFGLVVDGKVKWLTPAAKEPLARLKVCLGGDFVEDAFATREAVPEFKLSGWLVHPRNSAANANGIYFFLNGRFLRDRVLQHALGQGYSDFLMKGQYPKGVLYLEIPPDQFDVNVHPTKREVRFVKPQVVHQFVAQAVRKAVQGKIYITGHGQWTMDSGPKTGPVPEIMDQAQRPQSPVPSPWSLVPGPWSTVSSPRSLLSTGSLTPSLSVGPFAQLRVLGVIAQTYILCEATDGKLVLIDQHAAHERIGYEKLKKGPREKEAASQRLAFPLTWETGKKEAALLETHLGTLQEAGLDIEPFGGQSFAIRACPALIPEKKIPALLGEIAAELETLETSTALEKVRDHIFKTMSCHAQVRAGDSLSKPELEHLLKEMDEYHATHCPHGRPTSVEIPLDQIAKWFKRT
ncbi:MAG: DNA mismatch repair endonuclease MutL [Deltaproteobacteria bacterium]|nr:DNA mismatch repair endonuclease MutL [Deltaproteobacteria bacterium]